MTNYTLRETETQLHDLVTLTQKTYKPIVLITEETATPVAVVLNIENFEQTQRYKLQLFHLQRLYLIQWLERVEVQWNDQALQQQFVQTWQRSIKALWDIAPASTRGFCTSLVLAVKRLNADRLSHEQVAALFYSLELLRDAVPEPARIDLAYDKLIACGLPPRMSFSEKLIQSYMDEV